MAYTQPSQSAVNFNLITGYSQPSQSVVNFELTEVTYADAPTSQTLLMPVQGSIDVGVRGQALGLELQPLTPDFYTSGVTASTGISLLQSFTHEIVSPVYVTAPLGRMLLQALQARVDDHTAGLISQVTQPVAPNLQLTLPAPTSLSQIQPLQHDWYFVFVVHAPTGKSITQAPRPFAKQQELDAFAIDEKWQEKQSGDKSGINENWIELQSGEQGVVDEQWTETQSGNLGGFNESWVELQSGDKFRVDEYWVERRSGDRAGKDEKWIEVQSGNIFDVNESWRQLVWANTERTFSNNALVTQDLALSQASLTGKDATLSQAALVTSVSNYSSRALLSPAWQVKIPSLVTVMIVGTETTLSPRPYQIHVSTAADEYNKVPKDVAFSGGALAQSTPAIAEATTQDRFRDVVISEQASEYNPLSHGLTISHNSLIQYDPVISIASMQDIARDVVISLSAETYNKLAVSLIVAQSALVGKIFGVALETLQQRTRDVTLSTGATAYNALKRVVSFTSSALVSQTGVVSGDTRSLLESTLVISTAADSYNAVRSTTVISLGSMLCNSYTVSSYTLQPLSLDFVAATNALDYNAIHKVTTVSMGALTTLSAVVNYNTLLELKNELAISLAADEYNKLSKQIHVVQSALVGCDIPLSESTLFDISTGLTVSLEALQYIGVGKSATLSTGATIGDSIIFTVDTLQPVYKVVVSSESLRTPVVKDVTIRTGAEALNLLSVVVTSTSSTEPENIVISDFETYIIHKGTRYEIIDLVLRDGIETYAWQGSLELAQPQAYQALKVNEDFDLYYFGQVFELMVEKRSLTRDNPVQPKLTIDVISRTARLAKPFTQDVINQNFTANKASVIADSIHPVTWQLLDWVIKSNRFAVDNAAPLDALQSLVTAIGGMLLTTRDGVLVAKPVFKALPWEWKAANSDHELNDYEDNISYSEAYEKRFKYNRITISDSESRQWSIRTESDPKDPTKATVILHSAPWCTEVDLVHTSHAGIVIKPLGATAWSPSDDTNLYETIEFKNNTASTQYPIFQLNSYQYTHKNLGAMTFDIDTNEFRTNDTTGVEAGYSIARIHYITRDIRFSVSGLTPGETTQFLAISEE